MTEPDLGSIHETILMHWTAKGLSDEAYVERLESIYRDGLWCSPSCVADVVRMVGGNTIELPRDGVVCFTELSRDNCDRHIEKYGSLGIGFERSYLLRHGANPVFYVQSGDHGIVNTNLLALHRVAQGGLLRDDPETGFTGETLAGAIRRVLSYCKPMSTKDTAEEGNDLDFYNEMEWRIAPGPMVDNAGESHAHGAFVRCGDRTCFRFEPAEVALLVVPSPRVRELVLASEPLQELFGYYMPLIEVKGA